MQTYPCLDGLFAPCFHDRHCGAVRQDVGELELDAVNEELIVADGGRVVGHSRRVRG